MSYVDFVKKETPKIEIIKKPIVTGREKRLEQFKKECGDFNRQRATGWFYQRQEVQL